ncbi:MULTISPECIES: hypothetical protein [Nocardia]|nr:MULTISPECIES: hypothetical protein [Nocardia]
MTGRWYPHLYSIRSIAVRDPLWALPLRDVAGTTILELQPNRHITG